MELKDNEEIVIDFDKSIKKLLDVFKKDRECYGYEIANVSKQMVRFLLHHNKKVPIWLVELAGHATID